MLKYVESLSDFFFSYELIEQNMADSLQLILLYLYLFWVTLLQVPACNEVLDGVFNKDLFLGMPCCLMACSFCSIMVALCCFAISVVSTWKWMNELCKLLMKWRKSSKRPLKSFSGFISSFLFCIIVYMYYVLKDKSFELRQLQAWFPRFWFTRFLIYRGL